MHRLYHTMYIGGETDIIDNDTFMLRKELKKVAEDCYVFNDCCGE